MADLEQDTLLILDVLHLLQPDDVGHGEDFHRAVGVRLFVAAETHPTECARTCKYKYNYYCYKGVCL